MNLEEDIFKKYKPDFSKIASHCIEKIFFDNQFKAILEISKEGTIKGKVFDRENNSEYLPLRVDSLQGEFVGKVRELYKNILIEIRDKYFYREYFISPQSNRITDLIIKHYNTEPEFLWKKLPDAAIFRNKTSNKWFGIIMNVDYSKIQKNKKDCVEIMNLKLSGLEIEELCKKENFYPAYHMNKKYWISLVLNDSIQDEEIFKLVKKSYFLTTKK